MEHRPVAVPRGATQRITRHRGVTLLLGDGTKVRLTHTPFSIGRGPGNDLVLVSFAVSREHARIISGPEGFVIEDLGSRNRLVVDGATVDRAVLEPGLAVRIGDIDLWLEREG
jgi:pSer/pThr/pTyr-binding forkhead associated (FHA) protein